MKTLKQITTLISTLLISTTLMAAEPNHVGLVLSTKGAVEAIDAEGIAHTLGRRSQFYVQETIITDVQSKAKIRFLDGNIVSLSPKSEFRIEEYVYDPLKASENVYSVKLLKGAMLSVSGAIVKLNAKKYKVETSVGTIGILGTTFFIESDGREIKIIHVDSTGEKNVFFDPLGGAARVAIGREKMATISLNEGCQVSADIVSASGCVTGIDVSDVTPTEMETIITDSGAGVITPEDTSNVEAVGGDLNQSLKQSTYDEVNAKMEEIESAQDLTTQETVGATCNAL